MKSCEVCQNVYENTFQVYMKGVRHEYDCFECAVHSLAPRCYRCGCKILGHGEEVKGVMFCSRHCARTSKENGIYTLSDQPTAMHYI